MGKRGRESERRRAVKLERRRVESKERKTAERRYVAEKRQRDQQTADARIVDEYKALRGREQPRNYAPAQLAYSHVPDQMRKEAAARFLQRMQRAREVSACPPGFSVSGPPWTVQPPTAIGVLPPLLRGIVHQTREQAVAFAWELAEGRVDVGEALQVARAAVREVVDAGHGIAGIAPEDVIQGEGIVLARLILDGKIFVAETVFGNEQLMTRILGDRWTTPTDALPIEDAEAVGEGGQE